MRLVAKVLAAKVRMGRDLPRTGQHFTYFGSPGRVPDGQRLVQTMASHHYLLMRGHHRRDIELLGQLFEIDIV